jgi:hypothetical protein
VSEPDTGDEEPVIGSYEQGQGLGETFQQNLLLGMNG